MVPRRLRVGKKDSVREEDVTVASLRSLDVNGITPAQILPLIRILKVRKGAHL
jgi:hypothetical protein